MFIPLKFDEILRKDQEKLGIVYKTVSDFSRILEANRLEFFPDYTDHGINHIENVLLSIQSLITEDSFDSLNSLDIAIIILSVLVHDIGMHVTHSGFLNLLDGNYEKVRITYFNRNSWEKDWELFVNEAKKFNQKQRIAIWGDKNVSINEPPINNLTDNDRKLIGEFIRRHHPRLAHEITLNGFPTESGSNINFTNDLEENLKDIIGLVARSHGIPIRKTFNYLNNKFDKSWNNPYDSKIIYIMGLLRIADYIQIDKERADKIIIRTKHFASLISKQEWEKHDSINFINTNVDDPELIYVQAEPKNSIIYLELVKLFKDIQNEIDLTWAIIGEVYGRNDDLKNLKYKYRRIISNLDDKNNFAKTVKYIPDKIIFDSDPEILKLLIGPLYGNNPTYGIRELLQNAVDACRERQFLIEKRYGKESGENNSYLPEIKISITKDENKDYYFTISDNGIGMTSEVLTNYFFKAGASFINSDIWKNNFVEAEGPSISRSGRFGVGVLAAFLLGEEIILNTRFIDENNSYQLIAKIDSEQIEVIKSSSEIGTNITIKLRKNVVELIKNIGKENNDEFYWEQNKLDWFTWFRFQNPKITYDIPSELVNKFIFLNNNDFLPDDTEEFKYWRNSYPFNYKKIQWTFFSQSMKYYFKDNIFKKNIFEYFGEYGNDIKLLCNGFCIPGFSEKFNLNNDLRLLISVSDSNAKLPLTLDRNFIEGNNLPFLPIIIEDIVKDIISRLITLKINQPINYKIGNNDYDINYNIEFDFTGELIFKDKGYILFCNHILKKLKMYKITSIWFFDIPDSNIQFNFNKNVINYIHKSKSIRSFNNIVLEKFNNCKMNIHNLFYIRNTFCKRVILKKKHFNYLFNKKINRADKHIFRTYDREKIESNDWVSIISHKKEMKNQPNLFRCEINFDNLEKYNDNVDIIIENFSFSELKSQEIIVTKQLEMALDKYLGPDYVIPYNMEERMKKYPLAFSELDRFIKNYL